MKKLGIVIAGLLLASVPALARHNRLPAAEDMQAIAFELQDQTWSLNRKAKQIMHYRGYWNTRALEDIRELKIETARLARKLDRGYFDDYGVDRQLARVNKAIHRVDFSLRRVHGKRVLHHKMNRIDRTFRELKQVRRELIACGVDRHRKGRYSDRYEDRYDRRYRKSGVGVHARVGNVDIVFEKDGRGPRNTRVGVRVD